MVLGPSSDSPFRASSLWALPLPRPAVAPPAHTQILSLKASGCRFKTAVCHPAGNRLHVYIQCEFGKSATMTATLRGQGGWSRLQVHFLQNGIQPDHHLTTWSLQPRRC